MMCRSSCRSSWTLILVILIEVLIVMKASLQALQPHGLDIQIVTKEYKTKRSTENCETDITR